ncbi:MAG: thioredoxin family protein [Gemmatimonadaceae bacterium]|nr:thioredoxin family protein [Gemmatimonadaceae bacterium]
MNEPEAVISAASHVQGLSERFGNGETFAGFLKRDHDNSELWNAIYKRAEVPPDLAARATAIDRRWNLLVLSEAWCGDSVNLLPFVARLQEVTPNIEMRLIGRDPNPDIMNDHLTRGSRSIPVVMVLDDEFTERGWWGPRPAELQRWVLEEGLPLPRPERYRHIRTWYARDQGRAVISEILAIIEHPEAGNAPAAL